MKIDTVRFLNVSKNIEKTNRTLQIGSALQSQIWGALKFLKFYCFICALIPPTTTCSIILINVPPLSWLHHHHNYAKKIIAQVMAQSPSALFPWSTTLLRENYSRGRRRHSAKIIPVVAYVIARPTQTPTPTDVYFDHCGRRRNWASNTPVVPDVTVRPKPTPTPSRTPRSRAVVSYTRTALALYVCVTTKS